MKRFLDFLLPPHTARKSLRAFVEHMLRGYVVILIIPFLLVLTAMFLGVWPFDDLAYDAWPYCGPVLGIIWIAIFLLRKTPPADRDGGAT
jgi:hypothetical protein